MARSSSTDHAPASVAVPILERRRRVTNPVQSSYSLRESRAPLPTREPLRLDEEPRSWDRARWVNEVRRFETVWDVDAPRSVRELPAVSAELSAPASELPTLELPSVTLVVYEWQNAEPGTLSWRFPSVEAAVHGARAIRNAVRWAVVGGSEHNLVRARELGLILAEPELAVPA